jgi:hypothetical protein
MSSDRSPLAPILQGASFSSGKSCSAALVLHDSIRVTSVIAVPAKGT